MQTLLNPRSVLVVGVSHRAGNLGRNIVRNLVDYGYDGEIVLFGRQPGNLYGHRIRTRWEDVPEGIDLGVLLVPATHVPEALERMGERGIRRAVVSTGGFQELGEDRLGLQEQVLEAARRQGIRFTGPNGLGVINMANGLCTPFVPIAKPPNTGGVHIVAQSGGIGMYYLGRLAAEALGIGTFVSLGNKLDLDECDVLAHLATTDPTLVCLYIEDVRDGRRFFELLRDYPCPVLVHKANVSAAGARAAASHTAAIAGDDDVLDAALRQAGAVRVADTNRMMIDAKAFTLPPMRGDRLLIVSRSGGHAVLAADLTERYGFALPDLAPDTVEKVRAALRAGVIRLGNPLDLGDLFDFDVYVRILEDGLRSAEVDGVVFVHVYDPGPEAEASRRLLETVGELTRRHEKPIFLCLMTAEREIAEVRQRYRVPVFLTPEDAMRGASLSRDRHRRAALPREAPLATPGVADRDGVRAILAAAKARGARLLGADALAIAEKAGFPVAVSRVARAADDVPTLAREVGFPLAMKILSEDVPHKSDVGGVVLDVRDEATAEDAWRRIHDAVRREHPDAAIDGVLLQRMEPGLREVFLGGKQDPVFGPVVMVGLGGIAVELFQDVSLRLAPVTERDIEEMIGEVVSFKAFRGHRNLPAADLDLLRESVARMAQLVVAFPEILEVDLNPLKLHRAGRGGRVVDARVVLRRADGEEETR